MKHLKLGSLFDGSGGFPLAGALNGIEPVWASEVEPYPIAVTTSRFPHMKHLGDVSKVNGAEIEPVDIITFGSPCQDMSVAGKRAGIKHDDHGDEETTRSGLFYEAIRIIKEMRYGTEGRSPTFVVWENVPGAFSSNRGEDFRTVLEELVKIAEPTAVVPDVPQGGWAYADCWRGDGWSLAYRVLDAQYWGVPQRRRRIYLVADFRGECAREVLFDREGLRGYFAESRTSWEGTPSDAQGGVVSADSERRGIVNELPFDTTQVSSPMNWSNPKWGDPCHPLTAGANPPAVVAVGYDGYNQALTGDKTMSITGAASDIHHVPGVVYSFDSLASNSMKSKNPHSGCRETDVAKTLDTTDPNPSKNQGGIAIVQPVFCEAYQHHGCRESEKAGTLTAAQNDHIRGDTPLVCEPVYCLQGNGIDRADTAGCNGKGVKEGVSYTLNTIDRPAVAFLASGKETVGTLMANAETKLWLGNQEAFSGDYHIIEEHPTRYIVRRLTPTECARLQGFPDRWGDIDHKETMTDEEFAFWLEVKQTYDRINGRQPKDYTEKQILVWYNKLHNDGAEYKMWGNGIALPCALYVMEGIIDTAKGDYHERKH